MKFLGTICFGMLVSISTFAAGIQLPIVCVDQFNDNDAVNVIKIFMTDDSGKLEQKQEVLHRYVSTYSPSYSYEMGWSAFASEGAQVENGKIVQFESMGTSIKPPAIQIGSDSIGIVDPYGGTLIANVATGKAIFMGPTQRKKTAAELKDPQYDATLAYIFGGDKSTEMNCVFGSDSMMWESDYSSQKNH